MTEFEKLRDRTLSDSSAHSEPEIDPHFEPIITLPEIKVVADEENEDLLFKVRAKLYRFDNSDDGPEWKERGTGEVKFLRNRNTNTVRIVMRRDKTFKVCANHFITPWMELKPSTGTERAFVYTVAADYADETLKSECLAIKFSSIELANTFKDKFNECKNIIKTKCDLYITGKDSEEELSEDDLKEKQVVEKLSTLTVSIKGSENGKQ
ncbi:hypothetical protein FQA39_LY16971 [Lamprigera yunnana]|nr:hypothetical protein FQA39_LY16971 [Lamprigera yunnana]